MFWGHQPATIPFLEMALLHIFITTIVLSDPNMTTKELQKRLEHRRLQHYRNHL